MDDSLLDGEIQKVKEKIQYLINIKKIPIPTYGYYIKDHKVFYYTLSENNIYVCKHDSCLTNDVYRKRMKLSENEFIYVCKVLYLRSDFINKFGTKTINNLKAKFICELTFYYSENISLLGTPKYRDVNGTWGIWDCHSVDKNFTFCTREEPFSLID